MSSAATTTNLGLPQWVATEKPERTDFNTAFANIDTTCPVGEIKIWPAAAAPTKYLLCDGAAVSRTTYSDLFALISTTYGVGDNSTTFNLPNLKGKVVVGLNAAETEFDALAEIGGEKTHVLTVLELPAQAGAIAMHNESVATPIAAVSGVFSAGITATQYAVAGGTAGASSVGLINYSNGGSDDPHNNLQPYITMNYIIRALA